VKNSKFKIRKSNSAPRLRRLAKAIVALAALCAVVVVVGESYKNRDYVPYFLEHKGHLATATESKLEPDTAFDVVHIELEDTNGLQIEGHLRIPHQSALQRPALIILGGVRTGRRTIDHLGDTGDWLVLALDYPYRGKKSGLTRTEFLAALPAMRRAVMDTVPAAMLAVDYLERRGDVDMGRVLLAGGSFGALFSPALAAADQRITAVAIFFGAGDLHALIDANLELAWPLKPVVSWIGSVLVSPLEPLKYIGRIAPRPVFFLNGTGDEAMPVACSRALHDTAGEPKTISWLDVGHVDIRSREFHERVLEEFLIWLRQIEFIGPDEKLGLVPETVE